jgi:hypothetical protein
MKQKLSSKKRRRAETILGKKILAAYTRGGWPHGWCEAWTDKYTAYWVDWRGNSGWRPYIREGQMVGPGGWGGAAPSLCAAFKKMEAKITQEPVKEDGGLEKS